MAALTRMVQDSVLQALVEHSLSCTSRLTFCGLSRVIMMRLHLPGHQHLSFCTSRPCTHSIAPSATHKAGNRFLTLLGPLNFTTHHAAEGEAP